MAYTYTYARPALTVDAVVFGLAEDALKVLLIQRARPPFARRWALPGGFVEIDETLDDAVCRELQEETGLRDIYFEQLYTFGAVKRDPRERVVSVAYYALVQLADHRPRAADDARRAEWFPVGRTPPLAFDHRRILDVARQRLSAKVRYQPIGFELLARKFTLGQLQRLYEIILDRTLDKRNFRRKISKLDILVPLDETETSVPHRAARLYRFDRAKYRRRTQQGFNFEL